jgi:hypothetical protein
MKTSLPFHYPWGLFLSLASLLVAASAFGAGYADAVLADGPIAYWRFNDATSVALTAGVWPALGFELDFTGAFTGDAT